MKRMTLKLNSRNVAEGKRIADKEHRSLSDLINEMLRASVAGRRQTRKNGRTAPDSPQARVNRSDAKTQKAHADELDRLARTGESLAAQTLAAEDFSDWE